MHMLACLRTVNLKQVQLGLTTAPHLWQVATCGMATQQEIPEGYIVKKEGLASILQKGNDVFYNEAQVTNRDLSMAVLRHFLPILEREKAEGLVKGPRAQRVRAKKEKHEQQQQQPGDGDGKPAEAIASTSTQPKGAWVLEGLAASGLRSIRYALEVPGIARIDANDLDPAVVESMKRNTRFNGPEVEAKVHTMCSDARLVMMQGEKRYDAVDLDPYGTPAMLLDSAVQSVAEGGILMVTATDMANLCGNNSTACWSNYSSYPIHRPFCHEMAVRILLSSIENHANRYRRHITPLLSLSVDFYVRVFVRISTSPAAVKDSPGKLAYVWQSSGCDSFWLQRVGSKKIQGSSTKYMPGHGPVVPERCPETGSGFLMGGPIWAEPIHDQGFVRGLLTDLDRDKERYAAFARIKGMLTQAADELPDVPLYYDLHDVCKTARCQPPKMEVFRSAIINAGYRVSSSHANPLAVKTDAPSDVLWDIVRCWVKEHPISMKNVQPDSYISRLLSKEPRLQADFSRVAAAVNPAKADGVTRFVQNPAHWGPKSRHGRPPVAKPGAEGGIREQQQNRRKRQRKAAAAGEEGEGTGQEREAGEGERQGDGRGDQGEGAGQDLGAVEDEGGHAEGGSGAGQGLGAAGVAGNGEQGEGQGVPAAGEKVQQQAGEVDLDHAVKKQRSS